MTKPTGRQLAWLVLNRIETEAAYANLALTAVLRENEGLERREKAFCTELVYGVLRHRIKLDYILERLVTRKLNSLPTDLQNLLRICLYQLEYLPAIPSRAVCHSGVELVKASRYRGLAPLTNGVLRNYLRTRTQMVFPDPKTRLTDYLIVEYSHPRWLVERWLKRFGPVRTEAILRADNERPPFSVRLNPLQENRQTLLDGIRDRGYQYRQGTFVPEAIYLENLTGSLEEMDLFRQGKITPQDESSMLVAHLVRPLPGELIFDLCAAPGGKSTHLAEQMGDKGRIVSLDDHPHKVELIRENAGRLHLKSIEPTLGDARTFQPEDSDLADAVVVDAPCSGTGVLRRKVDARFRRSPDDLVALAALQREILHHAATLVKPGGRLIYTTCTLEPEEDYQQAQCFLTEHPEYEMVDTKEFLPAGIDPYRAEPDEKWTTLLPIASGGDGFFYCRFHRMG